jgi:hypothetical protein
VERATFGDVPCLRARAFSISAPVGVNSVKPIDRPARDESGCVSRRDVIAAATYSRVLGRVRFGDRTKVSYKVDGRTYHRLIGCISVLPVCNIRLFGTSTPIRLEYL